MSVDGVPPGGGDEAGGQGSPESSPADRTTGDDPDVDDRSEAVRRFGDTLDALEARRQEVEERFLGRLADIDERIDAVAKAADEAREAARQRGDRRRQALEDLEGRLDSLGKRLAGSGDGGVDAAPLAWPEDDGTLRAALNRWLRWLLRDYLEVLDRRTESLTRRAEAVGPALERMRELVHEVGRSAEAVDTASRETARRTVDVLAALASTQELIRHLVDAKDAELLERATAGPLRRTDLLLDELARQQEALLAELIGPKDD